MTDKEWVAKRNEYNREKYDRVGLMLPKGKATEWKENAVREGLSLNAYIQKAVAFYEENCTVAQ